MGTSIFSTSTLWGLFSFSIFFSSRAQKAQNAHKRTKIKKAAFYAHKKYVRGKSHLVAYLRFCAFCAFCDCEIFLQKKKINKDFKTALMTSFTLLLMI